MKNTLQKKIVIPLAALAIVVLGGSVFTLSHLRPAIAHAQTAQVQNASKSGVDAETNDSTVNEKSSTEATTEKDAADGSGGHQDPQGVNVNHQFDGIE